MTDKVKKKSSQRHSIKPPHKHLIEAALREIDKGVAIITEHQEVLSKIITAMKDRKLSGGPPKQNGRNTSTLSSNTLLEKVLELQKASKEKTLSNRELKRETETTLELIRQYVKELNTDLTTAKTHYRPVERARGH